MENKNVSFCVTFLIVNRRDRLEFTNLFFKEIKSVTVKDSICVRILLHDFTIENSTEIKQTAKLYYINHLKQGLQLDADLELSFELINNVDIQEANSLGCFFKKYIASPFTTARHILFTLDHGNGFGMFKEDILSNSSNIFPITGIQQHVVNLFNDRLEIENSTIEILRNAPINRRPLEESIKNTLSQIGSISSGLVTEKVKSMSPIAKMNLVNAIGNRKLEHINNQTDLCNEYLVLTNDELSKGILVGFGKKIDVLAMKNCCMQMIETGFALKQSVSHLIASETLMISYGYNYKALFETLNENPTIDNDNLCISIINSYQNKIQSIPNISKRELRIALDETALFALNLAKIESLNSALSNILKIATIFNKTLYKILYDTRMRMYTFSENTTSEMVDLLFLVRMLVRESGVLSFLLLIPYHIFRTRLNNCIVSKFVGGAYKHGNSLKCLRTLDEKEVVKSAGGVSIFFPSRKLLVQNLDRLSNCVYFGRKKMNTLFTRKSQWDQIIKNVLEKYDTAVTASLEDL